MVFGLLPDIRDGIAEQQVRALAASPVRDVRLAVAVGQGIGR
jgi:hypothetical protein